MRLATWNVNSVRTRVDRIITFLERENVDALAMQETKCRPEQFPLEAFAAAGYEVAVHGLNQWNGVAIASRVGLADVATSFPGQPAWAAKEGAEAVVEARALGATVGGSAEAGSSTDHVMPPKAGAAGAAGSAVGPGPAAASEPVRLWSLYVPNGRELTHPHYEYKLAWLEALRHCVINWLAADPDRALALAGDWNVAPRDEDVWDMSVFEGATHVSAPERAALAALARAGLTEVTRERVTNYTTATSARARAPPTTSPSSLTSPDPRPASASSPGSPWSRPMASVVGPIRLPATSADSMVPRNGLGCRPRPSLSARDLAR